MESKGQGKGMEGAKAALENLGPGTVVAVCRCVVAVQMFNFLVVGVDSVSRLNFARQMPRTRRFLIEELGAVELSGFNKVNRRMSLPSLYSLFVAVLLCRFSRPH